ncbi:hypothetical protein MTO96_008817 [Rhipicephalus appendiculatus]
MDAGPILRDIMMGRFWDGGAEGDDSIFSDIAVGEPSPTTDEERGGAQYEPTGPTPTSPYPFAQVPSDEVHVDEYEDEPVSPGYLEDEEEDYSDAIKTRGSCMSKNAIAARENRIKKKLYVNKLERSVRHLSTENATLKRRGQEMSREIEELSEEVQYLRSVLCNADEIKTLVRSIRAARPSLATNPKNGVALKRERVEEDHDYVATGGKRRPPVDKKAGGVCIHVANGTVSLEFCHRCAANSKDAWQEGQ